MLLPPCPCSPLSPACSASSVPPRCPRAAAACSGAGRGDVALGGLSGVDLRQEHRCEARKERTSASINHAICLCTVLAAVGSREPVTSAIGPIGSPFGL